MITAYKHSLLDVTLKASIRQQHNRQNSENDPSSLESNPQEKYSTMTRLVSGRFLSCQSCDIFLKQSVFEVDRIGTFATSPRATIQIVCHIPSATRGVTPR